MDDVVASPGVVDGCLSEPAESPETTQNFTSKSCTPVVSALAVAENPHSCFITGFLDQLWCAVPIGTILPCMMTDDRL